MTAKMRSKPYRDDSRPDWEEVRVKVMRWCLRAKLLHNWTTFSTLLLATGDRPIVEDSRKDDYWGAKSGEDNLLAGRNVLGRLLMELREIVRNDPARLEELHPLEIPCFVLFGEAIPTLIKRNLPPTQNEVHGMRSEQIRSAAARSSENPSQDRLL
ncbi:conserved hypothetical protein, ribA/ribD-fused [Rhizobium sp. NFR07]|nr:conserved hypothetical protein, ribA/ribD-fused [Rhizobium sp. NFR07]